jgi:hypothetical protein
VRVGEDSADHVRYGLASLRWFEPRSFMFRDPDETSDADKPDIEFGKYGPRINPVTLQEDRVGSLP